MSLATSDSSNHSFTKKSGSISLDLQAKNDPKWRRWIDNKYARPIAIYLGLLLIASAYSNWQPLFLILNNMGAYGWICNEDSTHDSDFALCDEQYDYLSQIYSVAGNMAYVVGLLAGILMDTIGGRSTMTIGVVVCYVGWIMLILSSESIQLYWPGLIMLGCAENLLGFPGFLVAEFWPTVRDTCASLCIAMQMLSSWMPVVIWAAIEHSDKANVGRMGLIYYLIICAIPSIAMIVATPGRKSPIIIAKKLAEEIEAGRSGDDSMTTKEKLLSKEYWKSFGHHVLSFDFILFTAWYVMLTLGFGFYNTKVMQMLGQDVGEFIGVLNPFRALIGPMMGAASDVIGAFPMLILDNVLLVFGFGIALIPTKAAGYTSAVFYIMGRSFCFTTKYIYVQNFYPAEHFGKLAGIISFVGGMFGFMNVWFQVLPYDPFDEYVFCTIFMLVIITIPIYFYVKARKLAKNKAAPASSKSMEEAMEDESSSSDDQ